MRMFENGVLSMVLGPTGDKVTGEWSRLHNEDIHGPGHISRMEKIRSSFL